MPKSLKEPPEVGVLIHHQPAENLQAGFGEKGEVEICHSWTQNLLAQSSEPQPVVPGGGPCMDTAWPAPLQRLELTGTSNSLMDEQTNQLIHEYFFGLMPNSSSFKALLPQVGVWGHLLLCHPMGGGPEH